MYGQKLATKEYYSLSRNKRKKLAFYYYSNRLKLERYEYQRIDFMSQVILDSPGFVLFRHIIINTADYGHCWVSKVKLPQEFNFDIKTGDYVKCSGLVVPYYQEKKNSRKVGFKKYKFDDVTIISVNNTNDMENEYFPYIKKSINSVFGKYKIHK